MNHIPKRRRFYRGDGFGSENSQRYITHIVCTTDEVVGRHATAKTSRGCPSAWQLETRTSTCSERSSRHKPAKQFPPSVYGPRGPTAMIRPFGTFHIRESTLFLKNGWRICFGVSFKQTKPHKGQVNATTRYTILRLSPCTMKMCRLSGIGKYARIRYTDRTAICT